MRISDPRVLLPALALIVVACAPCHRPPGPPQHGMGMACGHDACVYQSRCYSDGAVRSDDGVCQACAAGKWVAATGCREHGHEDGCKMGKGAPCGHERHERQQKKP